MNHLLIIICYIYEKSEKLSNFKIILFYTLLTEKLRKFCAEWGDLST